MEKGRFSYASWYSDDVVTKIGNEGNCPKGAHTAIKKMIGTYNKAKAHYVHQASPVDKLPLLVGLF